MAKQKKVYSGNRNRGGTPGKATDTGFAASGNLNKSKKNYRGSNGVFRTVDATVAKAAEAVGGVKKIVKTTKV